MKNMLHNISNVSSTNLGKCYLLPIKAACYIAMKWGGREKQERGEQTEEVEMIVLQLYHWISWPRRTQ